MGSDTRRSVQMDNEGNVVNDNFGAAMSRKPDANTAGPVVRVGNVVTRYEAATGEVTTSGSTKISSADPVAKPFGYNEHGQSVDLSHVTEKSVVTLPGLGDSRVDAWVAMGILRKAANGQGYEMVGSAATTQQQPAGEQPPPKPDMRESASTLADVKDVPPVSEASDSFQKELENSGAVYEQVITSIGQGKTPDFAEIARQNGEEAETFVPRAERLHGELLASGQAVLRNVGVTDGAAFEAWATAQRPEQAGDAVRAMMSRDVSKLAALGREYAAQRSESLARAIQSKGVDVTTDNGSIFLNISQLEKAAGITIPRSQGKGDFAGQSNTIALSEALRLGYVTINDTK